MHRTSRYLRRADKDDNRSSSPSSSSDRSNRGSTDRHINRHRRDDDIRHEKRKGGNERGGNDSSRRRRQSRRHRFHSSEDSCSGSRSRSLQLKPEKFSGQGSVETFLMQFENCSTYNRWSSSEKQLILAGHCLDLRHNCCGATRKFHMKNLLRSNEIVTAGKEAKRSSKPSFDTVDAAVVKR